MQTTSLDSNKVALHNVVAPAAKLQDGLLRHFTLRKDLEAFIAALHPAQRP
jgi:hypothetical protein